MLLLSTMRIFRWSRVMMADVRGSLALNMLRWDPPIAFTAARAEACGHGAWQDAVASGSCLPHNGRAALITGGTRGIGKEVCLGLAARGFEVTFTGRNVAAGSAVEAEIKDLGGLATFARLDFEEDAASEHEEDPIVVFAQKHFIKPARPLHLLVNAAGVMGASRGITSRVNLIAPFILTATLLPHLSSSSLSSPFPSRVVNVASSSHLRSGFEAVGVPDGMDRRWEASLQTDDRDDPLLPNQGSAFFNAPDSKNLEHYAATKFALLLVSRETRRRLHGLRRRTLSVGSVQRGKSGGQVVAEKVGHVDKLESAARVIVRDCHPGLVWTELLQAKLLQAGPLFSFRKKLISMAAKVLFRSPRQGAAVVLEASLRGCEDGARSQGGANCQIAAENFDEDDTYLTPSGSTESPQGLIAEGRRGAARSELIMNQNDAGTLSSAMIIDRAALSVWERLARRTGVDWPSE
mmetsp:Transcript_59520/g.116763  ORF Transcript_59520/g.116763 Transcript_59520/m.116763 type:complete len:464 (-) Transcript_59520:31-1422(-)